MKYFVLFFCAIVLVCCTSSRNEFYNAYNKLQQDSLLTNIVTYVYINAPESTDSTKWQPKFRSFYEKNLYKFTMEDYTIAPNGWHYFFMIRPVGNSEKRRGVIGKFRLKPGSLMPTDFEEVVNTPHLNNDEVKERGAFLFNMLVKNDNLDKYLGMKHYVEWPDSTLVYDKNMNKWVVPGKRL